MSSLNNQVRRPQIIGIKDLMAMKKCEKANHEVNQ
jgi:hypothetical protein